MAARYFGTTISGFLGRSFLCNLKRYPSACKAKRTIFSGFVFFPLIFDIIRERVAVSTVSVMNYTLVLLSGGGILSALRQKLGRNEF